jgi:hypothetical protein
MTPPYLVKHFEEAIPMEKTATTNPPHVGILFKSSQRLLEDVLCGWLPQIRFFDKNSL